MILTQQQRERGDIYHAPLFDECRERLNDRIVGRRVRITHYGSTLDEIGETEYVTIRRPVEYRSDTGQLILPETGVYAYLRQLVLPAVTLRPFVLIDRRQIVISSLLTRLDGSIRVEHFVLRSW